MQVGVGEIKEGTGMHVLTIAYSCIKLTKLI